MKTRRKAREIAFQFLYKLDVDQGEKLEGEGLEQQLEKHFEHFDVAQEIQDFVGLLVRGVTERRAELDSTLSQHAKGWQIGRMAAVDRTLLRMGAFEILHIEDIETQVAINEALELAKQFGSADTPSFLNGVLDAVAKA